MFKQANEDYRSEIRRLKGNGLTQEEVDECISPWEADVVIYYDEYKEIRSRKWQMEATKLAVPLPSRPFQEDTTDPSGHWEFLGSIGTWVLTAKGVHYMRREIREVQRTEHERRLRWVTPAVALLALSVSLFNLISSKL